MTLRPSLSVRILSCLAAGLCVGTSLHAQTKKNNPASKFYVADVNGEAQVDQGDRIDDIEKKSVYNAEGTTIETKSNSNYAMVYSNGTGIYFDPATRVHVKQFEQEPFKPNRSDMDVEPSISQTHAFVDSGLVSLCTSKQVAGSNMTYQTPFGSLNMRGRKAVIDVKGNTSTYSMLEGDSTVRKGDLDMGGFTVHEGEQAVVTQGSNGSPNTIVIQKIPKQQMQQISDKVGAACLARKTVYFEVRAKKSDGSYVSQSGTAFDAGGTTAGSSSEEIVAVPVVSAQTPVTVVSAANLSK